MNLYSWLEVHGKERPDKVCIKTREKDMTFAEIRDATRRLAGGLRDAGLKPGDHVSMVLPNIPEFVISYMAIAGMGATVVPVNPAYTARELAHILDDSDSKGVILEKSAAESYREVLEERSLGIVITTGEEGNFKQWLCAAPMNLGEDFPHDTVAAMVYSSGLTGYPMGAMLTHGNLEHNSDLMRTMMDCTHQDMTMTVIPLFHSFSASVNMLSMLNYGGTIYLMKRLDFKEFAAAVNEGGITAICAVPTLFFGLIHHPEVQGVDYAKVSTLIAGGSALPPQIYNDFKEKYHQELRQGYGITEASPVCSVNRKHRVIKPETIGQTVAGVEVMVVDDNGRPLPAGQHGELLFKGPNIMKGYYKRPAETAEIIKDGWLYTGDLGFVDSEGYITITGYKKEMVITSGFNVYSREVEGVLNAVPGVKDSTITGVPDLMRGAIIKAYIARDNLSLTEQEVKQFSRKRLASYKNPRIIVFVDEIPRDTQGKVILSKLP